MWSCFRSRLRQPSACGEPRRNPPRTRAIRSTVLTAALNFFWTFGAVSVVIVGVICLNWTAPPAKEPARAEPPGSGIILRTEVTTIWVPGALRDRARHPSGLATDHVAVELETYLVENGWGSAWYALTYRGHRADGGFAEITLVRRLSGAADHRDEFQAVMATVAGRPSLCELGDFSHAAVEVIPDALKGVDPHEAMSALLAGGRARDQGSAAAP
jgi:hypothetical protein